MSSAITTSVFMLAYDFESLQAAVLDADSSATTYKLEHPSHAGMEYNNPYNATFVVGPWASKTFPSSPWSTGRFHWVHPEIEEEKEPWFASIDCPMSKATILQCSKIRGFGDQRQTLAVPATIAHDTSAQSTSGASETGSASEVVETGASSREATATETSSSAAIPQETSGVDSGAVRIFSAIVMAGIASVMVL
ncbi:hypothetical protein NM208_g2711 [Fusarium decemcellulare]|uniref:Uncharacterized protein n=1 Tax=Fusarium decemcellulare TaxID=57161 RepID=A0ACC1SRP8_9HYPO|nr:hypothetical protein NM208_g2711 [Fusarium decemcellulare]